MTPLSYVPLQSATSFSSEQCPNGVVGYLDATLRLGFVVIVVIVVIVIVVIVVIVIIVVIVVSISSISIVLSSFCLPLINLPPLSESSPLIVWATPLTKCHKKFDTLPVICCLFLRLIMLFLLSPQWGCFPKSMISMIFFFFIKI